MFDDKLDSKTKEEINSNNKKRLFKSKSSVVIVVVLLVLGSIAAILLYISNNKDTESTQSISVCNGEILDEAVNILSPIDYSKTEQLRELNTKIVELPDYEKDPNCLYPVMQGYVFTGYLTKSVETFKKFESVYGDGSQFAGNRFYTNLESLRQQVAGFEKRIEELRTGSGNNTFGVSAPPKESQGSE